MFLEGQILQFLKNSLPLTSFQGVVMSSRLWTEILTDFDPEEETANFGTRVSLVSDGSLYEVRHIKDSK